MVSDDVGSYLSLRSVAIREEFFLVVEQLFARLCAVLRVLRLDNSVDWAGLYMVSGNSRASN